MIQAVDLWYLEIKNIIHKYMLHKMFKQYPSILCTTEQ